MLFVVAMAFWPVTRQGESEEKGSGEGGGGEKPNLGRVE